LRKIIICIFLVLTFICSCSEKNESAEDLINKAKLLLNGKQNNDKKKAIEYLDKAIKLQPNNAVAYNRRGIVYFHLSQYQQAIENFNKAIILKPDFADAYVNRGNLYFIQGNNELGCRDAQKGCELGNCILLEAAKGKGLCR